MAISVFQIRALAPLQWQATESVRLLLVTESVTDPVTRMTLASESEVGRGAATGPGNTE